MTSYVPPLAPLSFCDDTTFAPRAFVPSVLITAISFFDPQLTPRWNGRSSEVPARSTIFTNTPFTFPARPATVTCPGFATEPVPVVPIDAVNAHLLTFESKTTSYDPVPRCAVETTCPPRARTPAESTTANFIFPQKVATWNGTLDSAPVL